MYPSILRKKREVIRNAELIRMLCILLLSKLVALRLRMTSSMRGCTHCPVCCFGVAGVDFCSSFFGVKFSVGRLEIAFVSGDELFCPDVVCEMLCDIGASAVEDIVLVACCRVSVARCRKSNLLCLLVSRSRYLTSVHSRRWVYAK